jgi:succinyl-diaminopimelate desuccinylase
VSSFSSEDLAEVLSRRTLELVEISSPSGRESDLADHVQGFLEKHARPSFLRRSGSAVVAGFGGGSPRMVLAGHLDTVPQAGHPAPQRDTEQVVGLGTTDMKGALAVMMTLAEREPALLDGVGLVFYDCEETGFDRNGLRRLFETEPWLGELELALLLEPTGNALELGCLGTLHVRVSFHGMAGHSARPWTGENAIHRAAPFLTRIAELAPREVKQGPVLFREVLSVTLARGGAARNVIPDLFQLNVNFRFAPDRTGEEAVTILRSWLPPRAELEVEDLAPAAPAFAEAPALRDLIEVEALEVRAKQAWTDVAQFASRGVPAANLGPGIPELAHTREERIPVANLVQGYGILKRFLERRAGGGDG